MTSIDFYPKKKKILIHENRKIGIICEDYWFIIEDINCNTFWSNGYIKSSTELSHNKDLNDRTEINNNVFYIAFCHPGKENK